ncbi:MAG: hypothetical protein EKK37_17890 [Sphingobacteriales bacterium]|nr:MAG: hypothetical protein EKK37_17890 [Sphingobacteriales bacterium]
MWSKITSANEIKSLTQNTILIKYPINGTISDSFDDANTENTLIRIIKKIDEEINEVVLSVLAEKGELQNIFLGLDSLVFSDIKKPIDSLINDKVWWVFINNKK